MSIQSWWEKVRSSLFYVPLVFGIAGGAVAEIALFADDHFDGLPDRLTATVDSARAVLSVIAGATLTFAAIAFSVSLLLISAASSQFSPRVVHGLFRDPFNKRVMGVVVGTFVYCLVVMRAVRGPLEEGAGSSVVPSISVLIAVGLGLITILAIVAFINHSAHTMEVSSMLHGVTEEALERVRQIAPSTPQAEGDANVPTGDPFEIRFERQGWVQAVDHDRLVRALDPEACLVLDTTAGRYAVKGVPLCRVWPHPEDEERTARAVRASVTVGASRSMLQDASFGVRQLADVALKALSPGINDPTTAQDALFHMASVLREILVLPSHGRQVRGEQGRRVWVAESLTPSELVGLAFDEVRLASAGQPTVLIYLLEILRLLVQSLPADTAAEVAESLRTQAGLVLEVAELDELPEADRARVRAAYAKRFSDSR